MRILFKAIITALLSIALLSCSDSMTGSDDLTGPAQSTIDIQAGFAGQLVSILADGDEKYADVQPIDVPFSGPLSSIESELPRSQFTLTVRAEPPPPILPLDIFEESQELDLGDAREYYISIDMTVDGKLVVDVSTTPFEYL